MKQLLLMLALGLMLSASPAAATHDEYPGYRQPDPTEDYRLRERLDRIEEQERAQQRRLQELERQQQWDQFYQPSPPPPRRSRDPVSEYYRDLWQRKSR